MNSNYSANKTERKISQISDYISHKKIYQKENLVNSGSPKDLSKNKSNKGHHKYQKSKSLNNISFSENKKNYLEQNIDDIIQGIEKSEN